jgi:C4-dicarboxylate transporter DctQ subunit
MGAKFVWDRRLMGTDQVSPDLELPSWIVYACIPLGSYLMCFRFLQVLVTFWKTGELPHHDAPMSTASRTSKRADRDRRSVMSALIIFGCCLP